MELNIVIRFIEGGGGGGGGGEFDLPHSTKDWRPRAASHREYQSKVDE